MGSDFLKSCRKKIIYQARSLDFDMGGRGAAAGGDDVKKIISNKIHNIGKKIIDKFIAMAVRPCSRPPPVIRLKSIYLSG